MPTLWTQTGMPDTSQLKDKKGFPRGINVISWRERVGDQIKQMVKLHWEARRELTMQSSENILPGLQTSPKSRPLYRAGWHRLSDDSIRE